MSDNILEKISQNVFDKNVPYKLVNQEEGFRSVLSLEWDDFSLEIRNDFFKLLREKRGGNSGSLWNFYANKYRLEEMDSVESFFRKYGWSSDQINAVTFNLGNVIIYKNLIKEMDVKFSLYDEMWAIYEQGFIPVEYTANESLHNFTVMKPYLV